MSCSFSLNFSIKISINYKVVRRTVEKQKLTLIEGWSCDVPDIWKNKDRWITELKYVAKLANYKPTIVYSIIRKVSYS